MNGDPYSQQQAYPDQQVVQQVPVSSDELYANALQEDRIKNVIAQISPDTQLYDVEMRIRGYRKKGSRGNWVKVDDKAPEVNATLVSRYISYLGSIMNQNTSLTNLSGMQINKIMARVIEYISDDLDANAHEYGLHDDYTERTRIGHIILNSTFMVLNRALNGMESRRLWRSLSLIESSSMGQPQKKGFLGQLGEAAKFWG